MDYKLKDPSVVSELHPGDRITAKVLADKDGADYTNIRLDDVVVIEQARPDYKPAVAYHVPTAGDQVPDFRLLNQSDHTIHLDQFKGKLVLMTFIYTRCQLADFCPRMSPQLRRRRQGSRQRSFPLQADSSPLRQLRSCLRHAEGSSQLWRGIHRQLYERKISSLGLRRSNGKRSSCRHSVFQRRRHSRRQQIAHTFLINRTHWQRREDHCVVPNE